MSKDIIWKSIFIGIKSILATLLPYFYEISNQELLAPHNFSKQESGSKYFHDYQNHQTIPTITFINLLQQICFRSPKKSIKLLNKKKPDKTLEKKLLKYLIKQHISIYNFIISYLSTLHLLHKKNNKSNISR